MKLRYLGHSAFQVDAGGRSFLFDPFITGNPVCPVTESELNPDYILLSHYHDDHLGDTVTIAKRSGATVIATHEIGVDLQEKGCLVHDMHIGGKSQFEFGEVRCTLAFHGSGIAGGLPCGFVLTVEGKTIYHAGDTALFSDMKLLPMLVPQGIDVALLPIGDRYTMGPEDAAQAAGWIKPRVVIPMHWGTFPALLQDPALFVTRAARTGETKPLVLRPGDTHEL